MEDANSHQKLQESDIEIDYEQYYKRLYNYFYFRMGNHYDAEDLTETVFEKVINSAYDVTRASFDVWIFTIARNTLVDYTRRTKTEEIPPNLEADANPESSALENERDRVLADAVAMLPEKEKNILTMRYFAQLKNKEIAHILGYTQTNINVILHRALRKLRDILKQKGVTLDE